MFQLKTMSLSRRLIVYFAVVIVFTLALVGVFSYIAAARVLDSHQESRLRQIVGGTAAQSDLYLQNYERAGNVLITDDAVKRFLDIDPKDSYSYVTYLDRIKRNAFATAFEHFPHISSLYLLGRHGRYVLENNYVTPMYEIDRPNELYDEYMTALKGGHRMAILHRSLRPNPSRHFITLIRPLRGYSTYEFNGILAMEVNAAELGTLWENIDLGPGGYFFIVDSDGRYIFHPQAGRFGESAPDGLLSAMHGTEGAAVFADGANGQQMLVWSKSSYSGWTLAASVPMEVLRLPVTVIRTVVLTVGGAALIFGLWIAYRFVQSINKPIQVLKEGMRQTEIGNWHVLPPTERKDEIGSLIRSYNNMVKRLSDMIDRVYKAELDRQRAEFQALQLQINPHFLYNTLETINSYAAIQESREIREIVDAMAYMLRYALHADASDITVANELNHVRNYLIILKHRMLEEFEIEVDVPPELLLEPMVRFTLQPLVENAFEHGFRKKFEPGQRILIGARLEGSYFFITVEDNGAGMAKERLAAIRRSLSDGEASPERREGIGLLNVHRRIRMAFGEEYGLAVESEEGRGTLVEVRMPRAKRRQGQAGRGDLKRSHVP